VKYTDILSLPLQLERLREEDRWDEGLDEMEVVRAWTGVVLDQAGYEEVAAKKEWVKAIETGYQVVEMRALPEIENKTAHILESREFEWGDWKKQEMAAPELVQASCYE
jgi:hypothetical protein